MAEGEKASAIDAEVEKMLAELTPERIERNQRLYAGVVARYYGDPDFKAKMDADPTGVLKAEGIEIPEGAKVTLLFNTEKLLHIVLPALATSAPPASSQSTG